MRIKEKNFHSQHLLNTKQWSIHLLLLHSSLRTFQQQWITKVFFKPLRLEFLITYLWHLHQCRKRKDFYKSSHSWSPAPNPHSKSRHLHTSFWLGHGAHAEYHGHSWKRIAALSLKKLKFHYRLSWEEVKSFRSWHAALGGLCSNL